MTQLTASEFEQADGVQDWRFLDGAPTAWFEAPSLTAGAELVRRIAELVDGDPPDVDLRASGLRVRIAAEASLAQSISAAAADVGLTADPSVLQRLHLSIDTADPSVPPFWRSALAYDSTGDALADPARRDPTVTFGALDEPRPLRNRVHVDVVRPPDAVAAVKEAGGLEASGPYGLMVADAEGNEVDLVPGDRLPEGPDTSDWWIVFSAMASYAVASATQAADLASAVAALADEAGIPLLVDLRPDGVTIDSGKDLWEGDDDGRAFAALAGRIQAAARELGLTADPSRLRFVQLGVDAVDVEAVRAFWTALLGYEHDPRAGLTDTYDPRRLTPVLFFQPMDAADEARRRPRDRIHLDLVVPADQVDARVATALAAGGRLLDDDAPGRRRLTDPEGLEITLR